MHQVEHLFQTLYFCSATRKHCGAVFVVSYKIARRYSFLLCLVSFSVCSYWLFLCLQAQNDLASLAFIPLAFLDTALCWWISFTILLGGVCFLSNLFFVELFWLNFFFFSFLNELQAYVPSTSSEVNRNSVTECAGKLLPQPVQSKPRAALTHLLAN